MNIAEEASGKLVTLVKQNAKKIMEKENKDLILIDGSPGNGCPVIASLSGVDLALIVTEPTMSGIHDLKRILSAAGHFNVKPVICINKYDINLNKAKQIEDYCNKKDIPLAGKIPFNEDFTKAMIKGKTITEYGSEMNTIVDEVWSNVKKWMK